MTSTVLAPLLTGLLAGLAIAMPLGAIGVLLLNEGLRGGWRPAAAGALGVATVDLVYAALAMVAGTAVAGVLTGHEDLMRLAGAVVIAIVVVHGVLGIRRGATADLGPAPTGSGPRIFGRFVAMTAVNPITVIYFTVLAAGLGDRLPDAAARVWFVVGVAVGSVAWQLALAAGGAALGLRVGARTKTVLSSIGFAIAGAFAVVLAWSALA